MIASVQPHVSIIGGGLAGAEAALQVAARGLTVELWEQRLAPAPPDLPPHWTPAHTTDLLAELVCSNSLKSTDPQRAPGLLKLELKRLGCRLLPLAEEHQVPGGAALCVDRELFGQAVTSAIRGEPLIRLRGERCASLKQAEGRVVIVASGPLTDGVLWAELAQLAGGAGSYFYDATAPILRAESVDQNVVFAQSRYGKGTGEDYLNCPFTPEEYARFRAALIEAEQHPLSPGDDYRLFEGCLPVEELARRGEDTLRFGPLKPRGLVDPRTARPPYAAVQLRWEDALRQALSLVGFQTRLRHGEQERVFRLIPGLERAQFTRFGRLHRNSYLDAPRVLHPTLQFQAAPEVLAAGQLTGLEGYLAAIASGLWAGLNACWLVRSAAARVPPAESCLGAMLRYMANPAHRDYAPTSFQFGMCTWLPERVRRQRKQELIRSKAEQAWGEMAGWLAELGDQPGASRASGD